MYSPFSFKIAIGGWLSAVSKRREENVRHKQGCLWYRRKEKTIKKDKGQCSANTAPYPVLKVSYIPELTLLHLF